MYNIIFIFTDSFEYSIIVIETKIPNNTIGLSLVRTLLQRFNNLTDTFAY